MAIGVALPTGTQEAAADNKIDALIPVARRPPMSAWARRGCLNSLTTTPSPLPRSSAASMPDIAVGTSVVPNYPRHPLVVSSQTQTVQAAADGRFTLGLGLGAPQFVEGSCGVTFHRPRHKDAT